MDWKELYDMADLYTFDLMVEADVCDPTAEEKSAIIKLGYYGKLCTKKNIAGLQELIPWKQSGTYGVTASLCDGPLEKWFEEKEAAIKYVKERVENPVSETEFRTDYGSWSLIGFTLSECGISLKDYR